MMPLSSERHARQRLDAALAGPLLVDMVNDYG